MLYTKSISIPKSTAKTSPKTVSMKIWRGVIHKIDVFIPSGHRGLARLQIFQSGHIICPINEDGYISGNKTTISGQYFIDLVKQNNTITLKGWNLDDTYAHEFLVHINVLPRWVLVPTELFGKILESMQRLFI